MFTGIVEELGMVENLERKGPLAVLSVRAKKISTDALRSTYEEIVDNIFQLSVFNRHKFKNMLWNLDNLKHEIRSNFQKKCFDTWHSVYLKSVSRDLSEKSAEDRIKIEIEAADKSDPANLIEREIQAPMTVTEDVADGHKQKSIEKPSHPTDPKPSAYVETRD